MQLAISAIFKRIKNSSDYRVQLQAITVRHILVLRIVANSCLSLNSYWSHAQATVVNYFKQS